MAIVSMTKLTLIAMQNEREKLLSQFARSKYVHLIQVQEMENTSRSLFVEEKDDLAKKMGQIDQGIEHIKQCLSIKRIAAEKSGQKLDKKEYVLSKSRREIDFDGFACFGEKQIQLLEKVELAQKIKGEMEQIDCQVEEQKATIEQLRLYKNLDIALSKIKNTQNTCMKIGICAASAQQMEQIAKANDFAQWATIDSDGQVCSIFVLCHINDCDRVDALLAPLSFSPLELRIDMTPKSLCATAESKINALIKQKEMLVERSCDLAQFVDDLKTLYDFYYVNKQLFETDQKINTTQNTFILQCFFPQEKQEDMKKLLDKTLSVYVDGYDSPQADEQVPTLLKNNKIVKPFESVTEMYSTPNYFEIDPNPLVAFFYWLFMGVIMGDVGYGILMALLAIVFVKFMKAKGGVKNLALVIGFSGLSTVVWGVLFGGWFAITDFPIKKVLLSPLDQPLEMILLCVVLGVLQLSAGIAMNMANKFRRKEAASALLDDFPWIVFNVGLGLAFINVFSGLIGWSGDFSLLLTLGIAFMGGGMAILVVFGGRKKKGLGKVLGGLGNVYNVINVFSDVLSYLRLFGLGLTTGVIGMVFNILAGMLLGNPFSFIFGVAVLIFGHGLNLAISLLGAYIHDARLQHIEFFGKFFTGDGIAFMPVANKTKYIDLK